LTAIAAHVLLLYNNVTLSCSTEEQSVWITGSLAKDTVKLGGVNDPKILDTLGRGVSVVSIVRCSITCSMWSIFRGITVAETLRVATSPHMTRQSLDHQKLPRCYITTWAYNSILLITGVTRPPGWLPCL
jgi:hypothetical protein